MALRAGTTSWPTRVLCAPSMPGAVLAVILLVESWEPSLLVRGWVHQGVVGGVAVALGYGLGALVGRLVGAMVRRFGRGPGRLEPATEPRVRTVTAALLAVYAGWGAVTAVDDHRWTWDRLGYEPESLWLVYGATLVVTAVVATVLFLLARLLRLGQRRLSRIGRLVLPAWIAGVLASVLVLWVLIAALNDQVLRRSLDGFNATFAAADRNLDGAPPPPESPLRSAGPDSEAEWDELGHEGRRFLTRGPDAAAIAELAPDDATEPIRVYVGRASADTAPARVEMAMAELERFGAFDRAAVLVVVPTGTGWVNEQIVQPVEYLRGGDVATVAVQYSHLPSPLAYLAEEAAAGDTGTALIGAVRSRIDELPADRRPDLLVGGESLGSVGGSTAFTSLEDLLARTEGSLWIGPPETMHLRREAERERRPGSPQIRPVVGDGEDIVFANRASDLEGTSPRSVFLQQADDPIVWWDWATALAEPDWLGEPLDPAVNPAMSWTPVTTFLNLAVDMAVSNDFDEDHGHLYGTQPLTAWRAMLDPVGWDEDRIAELRGRLATVAR